MENHTSFRDFEIVAFSNSMKNHCLLFIVFFFIYLMGLLGNIIILICVITDVHLHTPMYIFLCNLSAVDMIFTSSTLPKLMGILLTGNNTIAFAECFTQMCFYIFSAHTEDLLLSFMAYDRYVAICRPLYYHMVMNRRNYILFLVGIWISALANALFLTLTVYQINICRSNKIQQFFCEIKSFEIILCANTKLHLILFIEIIAGLFSFILSLTSYIKIISTILSISSIAGRRKVFSTCTSHLTVLGTFYGTSICMYVKPPSDHLEKQDLVFSMLFSVTPMLNPIIYSLRNQEVHTAMKKIICLK